MTKISTLSLFNDHSELRPQFSEYFNVDTTPILLAMLEKYSIEPSPIRVSFRDLVPWLHGGSRATHHLHSYPAKLLPQIAHFFLANSYLCPDGGTVLDPFSGSGTVVLEAALSKRQGLYSDANPFATFLTRVKTTRLCSEKINDALHSVESKFKKSRHKATPNVINVEYWYTKNIVILINNLRIAIDIIEEQSIRDFLLLCLSTLARKLSLENTRFSVPVRDKNIDVTELTNLSRKDVWNRFLVVTRQAIIKITKLPIDIEQHFPFYVGDDARRLKERWGENTVKYGAIDLVITSPPYAGAQKYIRASSLSMGWIGHAGPHDLAKLEARSIGREHIHKHDKDKLIASIDPETESDLIRIKSKNPLRAAITKEYLNEMNISAQSIIGSLKPGGYAVVIMGDNTICGEHFPTSEKVATMFEAAGTVRRLELQDPIKSRALQTNRAGGAEYIKYESIYVFQKNTEKI